MEDEIVPVASEDGIGEHTRLVAEITLYEKEAEKWEERSRKICRRYKDERSNTRDNHGSKFNILWSNVQTLKPALYGHTPKPNVVRRVKINDDLGRVSSQVLERAVTYFVERDEFNNAMQQSVLDRLLPGRSTVWVRYVPHMRDMAVQGNQEVKQDGVSITDDSDGDDVVQEVYNEDVIADYVHWQDFGHNIARTWEEVDIVWRRVFLTREDGTERFGDKFKSISLDYSPKTLSNEKISEYLKKATIYEIWDKNKKRVYWLHKEHSDILDEKDDPLRLPDFFPCPRPLLATTANDSIIPVPDYAEYQDQAVELDELTTRISSITRAIKVAGVYDASAPGVERLLAEGIENKLIPIEQWAVFGEKGGLKGVMDLLPVQEIAQTLLTLYEARDKVKADLYEVTGIADIMRGAGDPNETATAQNIKSQYGTMRLTAMQDEVQRFARDIVRMFAHVIAEHFSLDTIKKVSGTQLLMQAEKQQIQMQQQQQAMMAQQPPQPPQPGQPPAPPPPKPQELPEELQELLADPSWEEVMQLFRDEAALCYRIDIETDSTIKADQQADQQARVEFLQAVGQFMQQAMQIQNPELLPVLAQMLMFGVHGFKVGRDLEAAFEIAIKKLEKTAENPPPPQPDPMVQIKQQEVQSNMQVQQQKMQQDQVKAQAELENEKIKAQAEIQLEQAKLEGDKQLQIMKIESEERLAYAKMQHEAAQNEEDRKTTALQESARMGLERAKFKIQDANDFEKASNEEGNSEGKPISTAKALEKIADNINQHMQNHGAMLHETLKAVAAPKQVVRDNAGRVVGVTTAH